MARKLVRSVPATALTPAEAAASVGVGPDHFNEYIRPHLRVVRSGRKVLIPVPELEAWLDANAERTLPEVKR